MSRFRSYTDFTRYHQVLSHELVSDVHSVMIGDRLAVWNYSKHVEEEVEVVEKLYLTGVIEVLPVGKRDVVCLVPRDHTIFKLPSRRELNTKCECGAKHTSFQNIHLFYCPLRKDEK